MAKFALDYGQVVRFKRKKWSILLDNLHITEIAYGSALGSEVDKVKYSYTNNQLMSVSVTIGSADYLVKSYTYNPDGSTATVRDYYNFKDDTPEYLNLAYAYDALGRVSKILYTKEDGTTVERHSYEYDKNNNITREENLNSFTDLYEARVYTYDYAGQLKTSVISNITETLTYVENGEVDENGDAETEEVIVITETPYLTTVYTYDAVGNREQKAENGVTTTYTYNGLNQLVTETGTETLTYAYDSNGNQISITGGSTNKYFTYTPAGMLATYTSGSDSQVNLYNGNGQRVKKTEGSDVTNYFYQNDSVLYTTDDAGTLKSFNLLNVADAFATSRIDGSSESYYFYTEDQRGSTVNVLDNSGNQVVSYWYGDFGEVLESKATGYSDFVNEIQYTGGVYDELTGLLYLNARFYDPSTGRFITQDTYRGERNNADTWHLYAYCANNPINFVDPSGNDMLAIVIIGGGALLASMTVYYTTTEAFQRAWDDATNGLENKLGNVTTSTKRKAQKLIDAIGASFSKAKKIYNTEELHHIVAQEHWRAASARWVFRKVGKKTSDDDNLIWLKKGLHKRLHRKLYFEIVNGMMRSAYYKKSGKNNTAIKKDNVEENLKKIYNFLDGLNNACSF